MNLLVLDFDGVISDSAPEAFVVALRTYAGLSDDPEVLSMRQRADSQTPRQIRQDSLYARFVEMMPLGNRAEDFAVEISLLVAGAEACDQAAFDRAFEAEPPEFMAAFQERFYAMRALLRAEDPVRWVGLMGPYPDLVSLLQRRASDAALAIATAKDRPSVRLLLREYGIDGLFPDERLLDKEEGRSKRAHLAALRERTGVPYSEMVFVDDKVSHLDDVAAMGVSSVLASWGYNGEREQRRALGSGHRVCSLSDFESEVYGAARTMSGC